MTRGKKKEIEDKKISTGLKLNVVRNEGLEKYILTKPKMLTLIYRRATVDQRPASLRTPAKIPIGARGRKRCTMNVLYIGIQPNPDGRKIVQPTQVAKKPQLAKSVAGFSDGRLMNSPIAKTPMNVVGPSGKPKPALRTYGRSASTPLLDRPTFQHSVVSPDASLIVSPTSDPDTQQIVVNLTEAMGRLHFSSSESE